MGIFPGGGSAAAAGRDKSAGGSFAGGPDLDGASALGAAACAGAILGADGAEADIVQVNVKRY